MPLARRLLVVTISLLQLVLPLGVYARTPSPDTTHDFCSAAHAPRPAGDGLPAGHAHVAHCALCAHGAPPALPAAGAWQVPLAHVFAAAVSALAFALPLPAREHANARAPPTLATVIN
ncbi:MAG: DUF2946 family protein [Casimicrobiaceae bacterium]